MNAQGLRPLSPAYDPWDPFDTRLAEGEYRLTSVEFTVTTLCNLRCEHCAVGDTLTTRQAPALPLDSLLRRLDEVPTLTTLSITGGEPLLHRATVEDYVVPLLRYARQRGLRTQINTNLTLDPAVYEPILPYLDVLHISFNYTSADDFVAIAFDKAGHTVSPAHGRKLYEQLVSNIRDFAQRGVFVSAETILTERTAHKIGAIHRLIAELGCRRHEVHPLYPVDFARTMRLLSLDELRAAIHRLLDERVPSVWILFGTLPFFACSDNPDDLALIRRLHETPNVTVRNDPDGRNRLNVSIFTGDIIVTDFGDVGPLGNIRTDSLVEAFARWQEHPAGRRYRCFCPQSRCCGPNLLVAQSYYPDVDFTTRTGAPLADAASLPAR